MMEQTEKKIKLWNDAVRAKRWARCPSCGFEPATPEQLHRVRCTPDTTDHYGEARCLMCGQHGGWIPWPPEGHEAAFRRYEMAWREMAARLGSAKQEVLI